MLPDAVGTVSGYVVHFNPHLWPRTNQTMTSKVEMMQEKIKKNKKIPPATVENRKHKRLCSAIEIMLMFIFCLPAAAIQKKSGLKRAWPFREKSYNSLFQTEDKLRGSTGARYKCKSCKATLLESKSKTMELKMSLTGCLF